MSKVIVVGGGPAGMMAAFAAAEAGSRVLLLEQNEKLGKKLFITGKGRCNLTNGCEPEVFFDNVVTNAKFLYSAFYAYDNQAVQDFFTAAGCRLKEERGKRIFPASDHSSDVIGALKRRLDQKGVEVQLNTAVRDIIIRGDARSESGIAETDISDAARSDFRAAEANVGGVRLADGREISGDCVIIATGGLSYATTGATGAGYRFAGRAGHSITSVFPSLVPLNIREEWCRRMQGLSLKNIALVMEASGKIIYRGFGEMLFTHFGVSGPLILSASSYYLRYCESRKAEREKVFLSIDLKPALTAEQLDKRLVRDFEDNKNKQFKNILNGLLPAKMHETAGSLAGIPMDKKVNEITKAERQKIADVMKNLRMTVAGTRDFNEAVITRGGVSVREINPSTMESKKLPGLFFAGEVLDTDALTGGFNLQIAWSTGHLAGLSAHKY